MSALPERTVRIPLLIYAGVAAVAAVGVALVPLLDGELRAAAVNLPLVPFVASGIGVFALLAYFAAADVQAAKTLLLILVLGHALGGMSGLIALLGGNTAGEIVVGRWSASIPLLLGVFLVGDAALLVALLWLRRMTVRSPASASY